MKLEKVLNNLNSFEKNSFLKIVDTIIAARPKSASEIEKILSTTQTELKNADNLIVSKVFELIEFEFTEYLREEFLKTSSQLDILIDIITRDGNSIMKLDWFSRLYEKEIKILNKKIKDFSQSIDDEYNTPQK